MVSGKSSKAVRARNARPVVVTKRSTPWGMIAAVLIVGLFAGAIGAYYVTQMNAKQARSDAMAPFTPGPDNQDPSSKIGGVVTEKYESGLHVDADVKVAYTHSPPFGGRHDQSWASCNGVVYPVAVRNENMVHSLEHGAVWIAYNPDQITGPGLDTLRAKVEGQPYMLMSPYPGLDRPISLQSWGHQLKLDDPNDIKIDQFIKALRLNQYTYPEVNASCQERGPGLFSQDSPPPFEVAPPISKIDGTKIVPEVDVPPAS
jgi:hypothetical protein